MCCLFMGFGLFGLIGFDFRLAVKVAVTQTESSPC